MTDSTALPTVLLHTAPTSIGLTPGFLSSAVSLHAPKAENPFGSTILLHNFLATNASKSRKFIADGPAAPNVRRATVLIRASFSLSKSLDGIDLESDQE